MTILFGGRTAAFANLSRARREKFAEDCKTAISNYQRCIKRRRDYIPRFTIANAPTQMQNYLLRLFAGGYNTLYDSALCWIEPTEQALFDALDALEEAGIKIDENEFIEVFNAWMISACDTATVLGHTISDNIRLNVRPNYGGYGLDKEWKFSKNIMEIMKWEDDSKEMTTWKGVLKEAFLDSAQPDNGKLYVDLSRVKPRFNIDKEWYRCEQCSEISPYMIKNGVQAVDQHICMLFLKTNMMHWILENRHLMHWTESQFTLLILKSILPSFPIKINVMIYGAKQSNTNFVFKI